MLTIHGRTVEQNKLYTGDVNWNIIKTVKDELKDIPVIANGGISNYNDIITCLNHTNADGVMSSEALLENPKLFSKYHSDEFKNNYINTQFNTIDEYINLFKSFPITANPITTLRGHLFPMLYRFLNTNMNIDLRTQMAEGNIQSMENVILQLKDRAIKFDNNMHIALEQGFISQDTWYRRHRGINSANRIVSKKKTIHLINNTNNNYNSPIDISIKLSELKARLENKRNMMKQDISIKKPLLP